MDVALIHWPAGEAKRVERAVRQEPRLLLVDARAEPPVCTDPLEDWVRLPASGVDTEARVRSLMARTGDTSRSVPRMIEGGLIEYRSEFTRLTPLQARLIDVLCGRFGAVVSREELVRAGWPHDPPTTNTLDVTVGRLRRALQPLGLRLRTVRSRGYLLSPDED
jgi:DNA-binding response OmpR family regulator